MSPSHRENLEYKHVSCISYFPDGMQMISRSDDKTIRQWDLREGKEIEEAREVCENRINAVGVSRDGRWVVTAGRELKVSEVETKIVRTFRKGYWIRCIDISSDSTLLAGGSIDSVQIWSLETGELVAGPFKPSGNFVDTLRLSEDSRKLAAMSNWGRCLQVWDVQAQKLDITVQNSIPNKVVALPVFWTTNGKSIVASFSFIQVADECPRMIYEFDASTLRTVGAPFKGHTDTITGLALSSDCVLLISSSYDNTIKLWAFESRQFLSSFDVECPLTLVLSPDSRQLAYTSWDDTNIYICNIPANILASIGLAEDPQPGTSKPEGLRCADILNSDVTRHPVCRKSVITPAMSLNPCPPRPLPTSDQHAFLRFLRKLLSSSPGIDAIRTNEPRNPLDFPATSPLPRPLIKPDENSRPPITQSSVVNTSPTLKSSLHRLLTWWPFQTKHASPAINVVDVPLAPGKLRYATAGAPGPDDDLIRDEDYVSPPSFAESRFTTTIYGKGGLCRRAWKWPVLFLLVE
ncbi:uncharacterized protein BJ212DRAFT_1482363 [Suillus subaureus]|uniref:Anaphase-promoting complex subunit 4 WD40 domain-containing protein n=1 Tax=Suillus subaureus TaxID=48587 RepID=A0A9P7E894_9AGAM|nr:uncharacterized protein BJ212DRAFT_1482363 [Suillus subaureus]KAG1814016.1 hypothetical protein BJ212DRAFT_1482363 [Suillus subaureus]